MRESWPPVGLQETLLPLVMLASIPPREHRSMNRNPAHGWINLTVVRSNEKGGIQWITAVTWRRTRGRFFQLSDWGGKEQRKEGMRKWKTDCCSLFRRNISPPQKVCLLVSVRKSEEQRGKERESRNGQSNGQRSGWDWYRFGTVSLSKLPAW